MSFLKGNLIGLKPLELSDLDTLQLWENDPDTMVLGSNLTPFSRFYLEQYILSARNDIYEDRQLRLVITGNGDERVGVIDLFDFDPHHRRAALGIFIAPEHRHRGHASEALSLLLEYARKVLSLKQVYCTVDHGNEASRKLFLRHGFEQTGTRKAWNLREGQWVDEDFLQRLF
jgi:diamine N-acetyltransferase